MMQAHVNLSKAAAMATHIILQNRTIAQHLGKRNLLALDIGCEHGTSTIGLAGVLAKAGGRIVRVVGIDTHRISMQQTLPSREGIASMQFDLRTNCPLATPAHAARLKREFPGGFDIISIMNPAPPADVVEAINELIGPDGGIQFEKVLRVVARLFQHGIIVQPQDDLVDSVMAIGRSSFEHILPLVPGILAQNGVLMVTCEPGMLPPAYARKRLKMDFNIQVDTPNTLPDPERGFHAHVFAATLR